MRLNIAYRKIQRFLENSSIMDEVDIELNQRRVGVSLDSQTTTTIDSSGEYKPIEGATTVDGNSKGFEEQSPGVIELVRDDVAEVHMSANATIIAPDGENFQFATAKNGNVQPTKEIRAQGVAGVPIPIGVSAIEVVGPGDTLSVQVSNEDSASNLDVLKYNFTVYGR